MKRIGALAFLLLCCVFSGPANADLQRCIQNCEINLNNSSGMRGPFIYKQCKERCYRIYR